MIVRLNSGLCNQMFMYAFGKGLEAKGKQVHFHWSDSRHVYSLNQYNVKVSPVSFNDGPVYREKTFKFDPDVYTAPEDTYFNGCWQTEKYFDHIADDIRADLTLREVHPKVRVVADSLRNVNSVAVHVRRGDYITKPWVSEYHGNLGLGYYERAYQHLQDRVQDPKFFIFSDDPEWCEQNMSGEVIHFNQFADLYLMSQCRNNIIANSSFSWWSAWLGTKDRIVVAPDKWFTPQAKLDYSDVVPTRWVKVAA